MSSSTTDKFVVDMSLPRGYRNNNPLNIRISGNAWKGKIPLAQNSDGAFEQFETMAYGYRAALINIRTITRRYPDCTVQQLIRVWAPDSDGNNSAAYTSRVCSETGLQPTTIIEPANREMMTQLVRAMSIVENGKTPQPDMNAIMQGYLMYQNS